jgi:hypothetical protein
MGMAVLGTLLATIFKGLTKSTITAPAAANVTSPQILQPMARSRKRLASLGGRQSTLLTGGLLGSPSLLKQGLTV